VIAFLGWDPDADEAGALDLMWETADATGRTSRAVHLNALDVLLFQFFKEIRAVLSEPAARAASGVPGTVVYYTILSDRGRGVANLSTVGGLLISRCASTRSTALQLTYDLMSFFPPLGGVGSRPCASGSLFVRVRSSLLRVGVLARRPSSPRPTFSERRAARPAEEETGRKKKTERGISENRKRRDQPGPQGISSTNGRRGSTVVHGSRHGAAGQHRRIRRLFSCCRLRRATASSTPGCGTGVWSRSFSNGSRKKTGVPLVLDYAEKMIARTAAA
jgi:hypothetical protein